MTQTELDALPVYGGGDPWPKPVGIIILRVKYCFYTCCKCGIFIDGQEAVVFRERGEALWQCSKAFHVACLVD